MGTPKIPGSNTVRWNPERLRLEIRVSGEGEKRWAPLPSLPDISGVEIVDSARQTGLLNISRIARRARSAQTKLKRFPGNVDLLMEVHAWNLVWRCLKRSRPAMASLLQSEGLRNIVDEFDGEVFVQAEGDSNE